MKFEKELKNIEDEIKKELEKCWADVVNVHSAGFMQREDDGMELVVKYIKVLIEVRFDALSYQFSEIDDSDDYTLDKNYINLFNESIKELNESTYKLVHKTLESRAKMLEQALNT